MNTFTSWNELGRYLESHNNIVYYKAPLDSMPVMVVVTKVFKNNKLRIKYHNNSFTADRTHLDRFRFKDQS